MNTGRRRTRTSKQKAGRTYFFSDAHLGIGSKEDDKAKEARIIRFLDYVKQDAEQLFIVGDLFDYWFEYRTVVPKGYVRLQAKLAELTDRGITVTFMAGNHDYWVGRYFSEELGLNVVLDPVERIIGGKRFYIHHGDGLIRDDRGYRLLKRIFRNRFNIWLYSWLHPDMTGAIARWTSGTSREYTGNRKYEEDDMTAFADQKIREGFDFVIMGHHHKSDLRRLGSGTYVNLGDWMKENTYAVFDGKALALKSWEE